MNGLAGEVPGVGAPAFARAVLAGAEAGEQGQPPAAEAFRQQLGIRPFRHLADDSRQEGQRGVGQGDIGSEVRGDLDPSGPGPRPDGGTPPVSGEEHGGNRDEVGQQTRDPVQPFRAVRSRQGKGKIVMRAESPQAEGLASLRFPPVELAAHEGDLLPERTNRARAAAVVLQFDRRGGDFHDTGVEVQGTPGGQVAGPARPGG